MPTSTRRFFLKQMALATTATFPALSGASSSFAREIEEGQPHPSEQESTVLAEIAQQFLDEVQSPGLSVAVARYGEPVYEAAFGYADSRRNKVTPSHLFRIASVTKPITSTTVFSLIEKGDLQLDDFVFGLLDIWDSTTAPLTPKT